MFALIHPALSVRCGTPAAVSVSGRLSTNPDLNLDIITRENVHRLMLLLVLEGSRQPRYGMLISPDNRILLIYGDTYFDRGSSLPFACPGLWVWRAHRPGEAQQLYSLDTQSDLINGVKAAVLSPDLDYAAMRINRAHIYLWSLESGRYQFFTHEDPVIDTLSFSADSRQLVLWSGDQPVTLWDDRLKQYLPIERNTVETPSHSSPRFLPSEVIFPHGHLIIHVDRDTRDSTTLIFSDTETGTVLSQYTTYAASQVNGITISADSRLVALSLQTGRDEGGFLYVFGVPEGEQQ